MTNEETHAGVTVVLPVYQNAETLAELAERVCRVLEPLASRFDLIFVNDASPDHSDDVLGKLAIENRAVRVFTHPANRGQQKAILTGLQQASGAYVVVMDADLQDPPEAIGDMLAHLQSGNYDAVFAAKLNRYQSLPRMASSWVYRTVMRQLVHLPKGAGAFVIMTRKMVDRLLEFGNADFYLTGLIGCTNLPVGAIEVPREARKSGRSSYSFRMRAKLALSNLQIVLRCKRAQWFRNEQT